MRLFTGGGVAHLSFSAGGIRRPQMKERVGELYSKIFKQIWEEEADEAGTICSGSRFLCTRFFLMKKE